MSDNLPAVPKRAQVASLDQVTTLSEALELCDVIAQTDLVPKALQGRPANILLVMMMGKEIGLSLAQAVREIYCPPGGMPQMRGRLLLARLRQAQHDYIWEEGGEGLSAYCEFTVIRGDNKREYKARFTIEDAKAAGLVTEKDGRLVALSREGRPLPWMAYRQDMLFWRAVARAVMRAAPEVAMGFDLMEAAPLPDDAASAPAGPLGGTAPGSAAPAGAGPPAPSPAPGPGDTAAELADLDARGQAWTDGQSGDEPASRKQQQELSEVFAAAGWDPKRHRGTILAACTAYCGRALQSAKDLKSREVDGMLTEMRKMISDGPEDALPVIMADKTEAWRQRVRESDPDAAEALFAE